jgi:hypothetical protein
MITGDYLNKCFSTLGTHSPGGMQAAQWGTQNVKFTDNFQFGGTQISKG